MSPREARTGSGAPILPFRTPTSRCLPSGFYVFVARLEARRVDQGAGRRRGTEGREATEKRFGDGALMGIRLKPSRALAISENMTRLAWNR